MGETRGLTRIGLATVGVAFAVLLAACGDATSTNSGSVAESTASPAVYAPSGPSSSVSSSSSPGSAASSGSASTSASTPSGPPGSVTLDWMPPTQNADGTPVGAGELAGYKILYGESPDALDEYVAITDPSATTYTFEGLPASTWYFAVVSVDSAGNESAPTNVIPATT